jgi:uncharacterized FlaG/YvyC family protein
MEINSVTRPTLVAPLLAVNANAVQNRSVALAARSLNQEGAAGQGREFSFSIDPKTKVAVVRIVDASTREVIEQLPAEYILRMAQQLEDLGSTNSASDR